MATLRMLTYNVMFGRRIDRIVDWLNRLPDYDVICLQEFPKLKIAESIRLLGRRPYGWRFAPSFTRRRTVYGELTIYRRDSLKLITTRVITLGINRVERSILKTVVPRSCLVTKFRTGATDVVIANVHIVAMAINGVKYLQVNRIMDELGNHDQPTAILGDFNISSLIGKRKLLSIMEENGFTSSKKKIATHRVGIFRHQFDYVFTKRMTIRTIRPYRLKLSDHYPIHVSSVTG